MERLDRISRKLYESRGATWVDGKGLEFSDCEWLVAEVRRLREALWAIGYENSDAEIWTARLARAALSVDGNEEGE